MNKAAMNFLRTYLLVNIMHSFLLGMYLGVKLLGNTILQPIGPLAGRVSAHLHIPAPGFCPHWSYSTSSDRSDAFSSLPSVLKESL